MGEDIPNQTGWYVLILVIEQNIFSSIYSLHFVFGRPFLNFHKLGQVVKQTCFPSFFSLSLDLFSHAIENSNSIWSDVILQHSREIKKEDNFADLFSVTQRFIFILIPYTYLVQHPPRRIRLLCYCFMLCLSLIVVEDAVHVTVPNGNVNVVFIVTTTYVHKLKIIPSIKKLTHDLCDKMHGEKWSSRNYESISTVLYSTVQYIDGKYVRFFLYFRSTPPVTTFTLPTVVQSCLDLRHNLVLQAKRERWTPFSTRASGKCIQDAERHFSRAVNCSRENA